MFLSFCCILPCYCLWYACSRRDKIHSLESIRWVNTSNAFQTPFEVIKAAEEKKIRLFLILSILHTFLRFKFIFSRNGKLTTFRVYQKIRKNGVSTRTSWIAHKHLAHRLRSVDLMRALCMLTILRTQFCSYVSHFADFRILFVLFSVSWFLLIWFSASSKETGYKLKQK